jgi:pimeloyl-ACP methyl ester carboxylesterase
LIPGALLLFLLIISFGITGCGTSMGVRKEDPRATYEQITVSAISKDDYSKFSKDVLIRYDLIKDFNADPGQVLTFLHHQAENDYRSDILFALAELNYFVGMRNRKRGIEKSHPHFFASVLYAYFYLLGGQRATPPDPFDRRFRIACDLYNSGLAEALADGDGNLRIAPAEVALPVGRFGFTVDTERLPMKLEQFEKFVSTDRFGVRGFSRRNREAGLGAPLIAVEKKKADAPMFRTFPGSLFLRVNCRLQDVAENTCTGSLEVYPAFDHTDIQVSDKTIPLERDLTAQLAYTIDQPYIQGLGFNEFLHGTGYIKTGIYPMQPYEPDKIPIVFVHGTFSSPVAWAEMVNTLRADPLIAEKYQIWNFFYDSGKRIGLSARELGDALTVLVNQLDPEGVNANLQRMIVIGHSQGGLLTKMIATDPGDAFVRMMTGKSLAELDVSEKERARVEQAAIFKPLPFVTRVVFISTPHRGSYLSKNWVRKLVVRMISFPKDVLQSTVSLLDVVTSLGISEAVAAQYVNLTSLDVMSPDNPVLLTLANIPLAKGVTGHSIIAIEGDEMPPDGDDGVVQYTSAHVDYVESEFIVRDSHSCQSNPLVIEEVRRILLEHLKTSAIRK